MTIVSLALARSTGSLILRYTHTPKKIIVIKKKLFRMGLSLERCIAGVESPTDASYANTGA